MRVSTPSGRILPKPKLPKANVIVPETWIDLPKGTSVGDALEKIYVSYLKTLVEKVMEAKGTQGTQKHKKVYWY